MGVIVGMRREARKLSTWLPSAATGSQLSGCSTSPQSDWFPYSDKIFDLWLFASGKLTSPERKGTGWLSGLCNPDKSTLCFFNPIHTSGCTYCSKNVSILLAMFTFQNMGHPQGRGKTLVNTRRLKKKKKEVKTKHYILPEEEAPGPGA